MHEQKKMPYNNHVVPDHEFPNETNNGTRKTMSDNIDDIIDSSSIEELKILINKAEVAIEQKKASEIVNLRDQMFKKARLYDMTPEEVLSFSGRRRKSVGIPKYRNPENPEQTWTGRGKKPGWLKLAADPEDFRIPE
ncbi:MAG: H-NS histone family protein [Candidatus Competibacteraceae bacterium]